MSNFMGGLGWANRQLIQLNEADETTGIDNTPEVTADPATLTPEQREQVLYNKVLATTILKPVMTKLFAMVKSAQEQGVHANITPYRDARLLFLNFFNEVYSDLIPDEFKDVQSSAKSQGKTRLLRGTDINKIFSAVLSKQTDKGDFVNKIKEEFNTWADQKIEDTMKGTLGSRFYKGAKGKAAESPLMDVGNIGSSLNRDLSSFMPPEEKFEKDIPENRVDITDAKEFVNRALEGFKENNDDPYISDEISAIISTVDGFETVEDIEDYLTTQARKYLKVSQNEDDGDAKKLSDLLADVIDNFRHFNLYKAVQSVPNASAIAPGSFESIKDEVIYDIEDFAYTIESKSPELHTQVQAMLAKLKDMKSKETIVSYLEDRIAKLSSHPNAGVQKLVGVFKKALQRVVRFTMPKDTEEDNESGAGENDMIAPVVKTESALTKKQKNNLLIEGYRAGLRRKVLAQTRCLF